MKHPKPQRRTPTRNPERRSATLRREPRRMSRISRLLSETGLKLRKGLGQNFLVNQGALEKIAASVEAGEDSVVLEIGCGLGNLTELLAGRAGSVVAVELDERFRTIHERELGGFENVRIVYGDFLELELKELLLEENREDLRVVGNIPYHLTSPILFKLIASPAAFERICLLMQREVALRLSARAGSRNHGILAMKARTRFDVETCFTISPGSFLPPPKVHSALVRLTPRAAGPLTADGSENDAFFRFIDAAFAQRRKMIAKSLAAAAGGALQRDAVETALARLDLRPDARAESLTTEEMLALFRALDCPRLTPMRRVFPG